MALINCPDCKIEVSDKAFQCPKCAYPINTNENFNRANFDYSLTRPNENLIVNVEQPNVNALVAISSRKSEGISLVLTIIFGVLGLLYGNPKKFGGVLILTILSMILVILMTNSNSNTGYPLIVLIALVSTIASIILGLEGVKEYNDSLIDSLNSSTMNNVNFNNYRGNSYNKRVELDLIDKLKNCITKEWKVDDDSNTNRDEIVWLLETISKDKVETKSFIDVYYARYNCNVIDVLKLVAKNEIDRSTYMSFFKSFDKS